MHTGPFLEKFEIRQAVVGLAAETPLDVGVVHKGSVRFL